MVRTSTRTRRSFTSVPVAMSISVGLVVLASLLLTPPPGARPWLATAGAAIALGSAAIYTGTALRLRRSRGRR